MKRVLSEETKAKNNARARAWQKANKEKAKATHKKYRDSKKHKPSVYIIDSENYVGVTENIYTRLSYHRNTNLRDVSEVRIIAEFNSREEALELEEFLHDLGYKGRHKNNTYK